MKKTKEFLIQQKLTAAIETITVMSNRTNITVETKRSAVSQI